MLRHREREEQKGVIVQILNVIFLHGNLKYDFFALPERGNFWLWLPCCIQIYKRKRRRKVQTAERIIHASHAWICMYQPKFMCATYACVKTPSLNKEKSPCVLFLKMPLHFLRRPQTKIKKSEELILLPCNVESQSSWKK